MGMMAAIEPPAPPAVSPKRWWRASSPGDVRNHKLDWERCWIAELGGQRTGSAFVVRKSASVAQLRMLILAPQPRGRRVGTGLADECIAFARGKGYKKMVLWTNSCLDSARHLCQTRLPAGQERALHRVWPKTGGRNLGAQVVSRALPRLPSIWRRLPLQPPVRRLALARHAIGLACLLRILFLSHSRLPAPMTRAQEAIKSIAVAGMIGASSGAGAPSGGAR